MHNLDRRQFLNFAAGSAAAAMLPLTGCKSAPAGNRKPAKQPNILFIMVDDLGPEWLSCYGGEEMKTPNLDR